MSTEKLKRRSLLAAAASVDSATAGALLAVDRFHELAHAPPLVLGPEWENCLRGLNFSKRCDFPSMNEAPRDMPAVPLYPLEPLAVEASEHRAEVAQAAPFDASRDTLLREPFASMLRPDVGCGVTCEPYTGPALEGPITVPAPRPVRPDPELRPDLEPQSYTTQCLLCEQHITRWPARTYRTHREMMAHEGHDWACIQGSHRAGLALLPRRWKRGQKRNRRQRREARAAHRVTYPRVRPLREGPSCVSCHGSGESPPHDFGGEWQEAGECLSCNGSGYLTCLYCGVVGTRLCDSCYGAVTRAMESSTLHAEDIPRVGERVRERAMRAPFGGAW